MNDYSPSPAQTPHTSLTQRDIDLLKAAQERYRPCAQALEEAAERRRQLERRKEAIARSEPLPGHTSHNRTPWEGHNE